VTLLTALLLLVGQNDYTSAQQSGGGGGGSSSGGYVPASGIPTGPIYFPDGTSLLPSITFDTSHVRGLFKGAGNTVGVAANAISAMLISDTFVNLPGGANLSWSTTSAADATIGAQIRNPAQQVLAIQNGFNEQHLRVMDVNQGYTELSGLGVTRYRDVATAGLGVPAIYASGRSTAQTAAVASVATFTPAADGSFEVSANVLVTTATTHAFTVTCAYTDEGNTARTATLSFTNVAGTAIVTSIANATGAVPYQGLTIRIRAKASTAITVATTGTFTTVTYNVEATIKQIS
jgi:hypothetical protein